MFKRIRQLQISLAAKCQLLFGAAVVLIISAALFVPWQRMEQLMEQLNERSAVVLAEQAVVEHVRQHAAAEDAAAAADRSSLWTFEPPDQMDPAAVAVRLVPLREMEQEDQMLPFERRAAAHFRNRPHAEAYWRHYDRRDGTRGYRYARPLLARDCPHCHAAEAETLALAAGEGDHPEGFTGSAASELVGLVVVDIPSQIEPNQLLLNRVFILTAGLLAGTLAVIVFYLITSRLILQPVRVLQETAEKVSEGDLNIRSDISTGDEFQQLSETFNIMLANLKAGEDQLRAMNKSLDLKLNQLAESNLALYESNRLKSEFLANVSHELRTPLNSILGFADLLKEALAARPDPKALRYLQNILNSGKHLLELINDLLDLAKIEAGRMEVRSEPLSLNDLFEGLSSILKPLTEQNQLTIAASVAPDVPILRTDPAKLQQVLYNFLSNAIKFSPPETAIDLRAERAEDHHVRISVADRGPGIEPDKQAIIFEKFRQIDGSATREHSGTGLGLAISKELAGLLGGSIGVRSTPGEGAAFWIVLPLKIDAGAQDIRSELMLNAQF